MMTDRKTISIMKACELVGVSRRTIYNWIAQNLVEWVRAPSGSIRIYADSLVRPATPQRTHPRGVFGVGGYRKRNEQIVQ